MASTPPHTAAPRRAVHAVTVAAAEHVTPNMRRLIKLGRPGGRIGRLSAGAHCHIHSLRKQRPLSARVRVLVDWHIDTIVPQLDPARVEE